MRLERARNEQSKRVEIEVLTLLAISEPSLDSNLNPNSNSNSYVGKAATAGSTAIYLTGHLFDSGLINKVRVRGQGY